MSDLRMFGTLGPVLLQYRDDNGIPDTVSNTASRRHMKTGRSKGRRAHHTGMYPCWQLHSYWERQPEDLLGFNFLEHEVANCQEPHRLQFPAGVGRGEYQSAARRQHVLGARGL